jgi:hypothetical protein
VEARETLSQAVERLIHDHKQSLQETGTLETGMPNNIRRGVSPGSFIDLLVKGTNRVSGQGFSYLVIAEQVPPPPPPQFLNHSMVT